MTSASTTQTKTQAAPPKTTPREKRRINWKFITTVVACQVAALLVAEMMLASTGIGEEEIFRFDKELGFVHIPNKRVTWRSEGYATSYFDANGLREKDVNIAKPADTVRIALLGDSLTEGLQVNYEDSFAHLIQERLGKKADGKKVQVLNFACSGYSTTQELLLLERQVLQFKPDLVLVCYNNRDLIENWSTADQVVTNVRPSAVHLPGGYLFIDNLIVKRWFKSPRGSFLTRLEWIREHSRIWGVYSAVELQMSQKNPVAKVLLAFWSQPKKVLTDARVSIGEWFKNLRSNPPSINLSLAAVTAKPAFSTSGPQVNHAPGSEAEPLAMLQTGSASKPTTLVNPAEQVSSIPGCVVQNPEPLDAAPVTNVTQKTDISSGESVYRKVVFTTMSSLLGRMSADCEKSGGKLAVVAMPVRAVLCPTSEYDLAFSGITYGDEIAGLQKMCTERNIPFCNVQTVAEKLSTPLRKRLYYTAHFTPEGHGFTANVLEDFCAKLIAKK